MGTLKTVLKIILSAVCLCAFTVLCVTVCAAAVTKSINVAAAALLVIIAVGLLTALFFMWKDRYLYCFWIGGAVIISGFIVRALPSGMKSAVNSADEYSALAEKVTALSVSFNVIGLILMAFAAVFIIYGAMSVTRLNKQEGRKSFSILNKYKENKLK